MKIVQIIPQLASGGAERFVVDLANELSLQHDIVLVVSFAFTEQNAFYLPEVSDRVKVCSLNKKLGFDSAYLYRLYKIIKKERPDTVHTHVESFAHFALLKWLFPKVKFVHTVHSDAQFEAGGKLKTFLKKVFFRKGWCKAATISKKSDLSFKEFYGSKTESTLIYNGRSLNVEWSDNELIPRTDGCCNLVSIAHISPVKNHLLLCSAVDQLTKKGAPIELYMFGRFVDKDIVGGIKFLNNPHIHLMGEVENPRQYLKNADVFCMSSVIEGMPISLIEALSCGLTPICTAVGGIVDIVEDGENGFLSQDMTVESYVKAIERYLSLPESQKAEMKQQSIKSAQKYSIEECAKQYEVLFAE
ncbi:MAG: glycosyltransferase [Alistipes sp.]|nr:glycosyltransferase [Alistipes sp.]